MITKTHTPENEVRDAIQLAYTVSEAACHMLHEHNPKAYFGGLTQLEYTYLVEGLCSVSIILHDLLSESELDCDDIRNAVMAFYWTSQRVVELVEKEWGGYTGMKSIGRALEIATEQLVSVVESWYKGPGPTKVAKNFADLAKVTGEG